MKKAYLKNLSGLLAKDGVEPENIELVLSWANYQAVIWTESLLKKSWRTILQG